MYEYAATVERVVDGDTVDISLDLGFETYRKLRVRLNGINTPELHDPDKDVRAKAVAAMTFLADALPRGLEVRVVTIKDRTEKYGRYLADIFQTGQTVTVQSKLITAGLAVEYHGEKR